MHAWSTSMLLLLHSTFMLSLVKMLLKGEVGGHVLKSWKLHCWSWKSMEKSWNCVFEFLWEPCVLHKHPLNANADTSSKARGRNFGLSIHLHPYFVYASSDSYSKLFYLPEHLFLKMLLVTFVVGPQEPCHINGSFQHMKYYEKTLSATSHINCIVAHCLINVVYLRICAFIRSWWRALFEWRR